MGFLREESDLESFKLMVQSRIINHPQKDAYCFALISFLGTLANSCNGLHD